MATDLPASLQSVAGGRDDGRRLPLLAVAVPVLWAAIAVVAATTAFIALRGRGFGDWLMFLRPMALYYGVWAVLSFAVYRLVQSSPDTLRQLPRTIVLHLLLLVSIVAALPFLTHGAGWREFAIGDRAPGFHALGVAVYLFVLAGAYTVKFYGMARRSRLGEQEARLRAALLQNEAHVARLDVLTMQINPHFLFNALNCIAALIETSRNDEAYRATELLGSLLRTALERSRDQLIPLSAELAFLERYVELETLRAGQRFRFRQSVAPGSLDVPVPALVLQPVVENTIKHAVNRSQQQVTVDMQVTLEDDALCIEITDDGPGLDAAHGADGGHGLANIRQRLELIYGDAASFECRNRAPHGVRTVLCIPRNPPSSQPVPTD